MVADVWKCGYIVLMLDYYKILGVADDADFAALKQAYYARAKECHPDRYAGSREKEELFKRVVEAFHVLSDSTARSRYDAARRGDNSGLFADTNGGFQFFVDTGGPILDSFADDILEELLVGNRVPRDTTLQTLMLDLERTDQFCLFRQAKNAFVRGITNVARERFSEYLKISPYNLLARYYLSKCYQAKGQWWRAERQLIQAIRIGACRRPPMMLLRIRREVDRIRQKQLGVPGRLLFLAQGPMCQKEPLPPDEEMRKEVSRAMTRLLREEREQKRKRLE